MAWLDCPECHSVLESAECVVCGAGSSGEYRSNAAGHFDGPFCSGCVPAEYDFRD